MLKIGGGIVLVVEGEKTADAANKLFAKDNIVCISWWGGAAAVSKSNWTPLFGKQVVIWPDNDSAGFKAAEAICTELRKVGVQSLHVVDNEILTKQFPEKWDLADPYPEGKNLNNIKDLIFSAKEKSIGIDQLVLGLKDENKNNLVNKLRTNEIVWRLEERLRPILEENLKAKPWEIKNEIQKEVLRIINTENKLHNQLKEMGFEGEISKKLAYQAMLYQAETGKELSNSSIQNIKQTLAEPFFKKIMLQISQLTSVEENSKKEMVGYLVDKALTQIVSLGVEKIDVNQKLENQILSAQQMMEKEKTAFEISR